MSNPCFEHGCAACCYDTEMPLTGDDIKRLEAKGHDRAAFVTWSEDGAAQLNTVAPLEGQTERPCFFLKENKCSVYGDRPAGCRIYPFVLNERAKVMRDEDCPHRNEFPSDPTAKRRILRVISNLARRP